MVSQRLSRTSASTSYFLQSMLRVTRRVLIRAPVANGGAALGLAGAAGVAVWTNVEAKPAPVATPTATAPALVLIRKSRRVSVERSLVFLPESHLVSSGDWGW